jgi:integrase
MPKQKRILTSYQGVYYIPGTATDGRPERIYYIRYRKNRLLVEEKAGRQYRDDMTPARASRLRTKRIEGDILTNEERRQTEEAQKLAQTNKWTIEKLWKEYKRVNPIKGIVTDDNRFENYIKPEFGSIEPHEILPLDVDRLRIRLLKKRSPATVKNVLELLRRIISFSVKRNLSDGLKFVIKLPVVNNLKTEDLNPEQLNKLLSVLDKEKNIQTVNLMRMALFTGMRRGELFRLKWDEIDWQREVIHLKEPKGGQDQTIPLNEMSKKILKSHPRTESNFVFPGRDGNQRTDITKAVNKIKKDAELPTNFRALHGLRHVYASMLASSGKVDLYTLQKLLTHKSPAMTQRYAHLRDDVLRKASNLVGDLIEVSINKKKEGTKKLK